MIRYILESTTKLLAMGVIRYIFESTTKLLS